MGLHTNLQIYTAAEKLLETVTEGTFNMRRDAKPVLGSQMLKECLEITTLIQEANTERDKAPYLNRLLKRKCRIETLLKVAVNKAKFSPGLYSIASAHAVNIGRQAVGWRNSQQRQLHDRQGGDASA